MRKKKVTFLENLMLIFALGLLGYTVFRIITFPALIFRDDLWWYWSGAMSGFVLTVLLIKSRPPTDLIRQWFERLLELLS